MNGSVIHVVFNGIYLQKSLGSASTYLSESVPLTHKNRDISALSPRHITIPPIHALTLKHTWQVTDVPFLRHAGVVSLPYPPYLELEAHITRCKCPHWLSRKFCSYGDVTFAGERLQNLGLHLAPNVKQKGVFIVPNLHPSVCAKGPRVLWSHPVLRPDLVTFYTSKGQSGTYPYPDPRGGWGPQW